MKKLIVVWLILLSIPLYNKAQLTVNPNKTPTQLVQQVLVGSGVTISNITFTGAPLAIAEFGNGGTTNLGIYSGVILSTGLASDVIGPNLTSGKSTNNNTGSDPQLAGLITASINDAAVLEFDFTPIADTIRFRYVFGSEEYPEFVFSYNDVFGFFITGPNPAGGNYSNQNIALVPGTTNTPVSIYNINNGSSNTGPCVNCNYYVDNSGGFTIEYDGLTTVLTAWALVVPCQSYHMKLAIGDAGDHSLDSGVLLEANSFSSSAVQISSDFSIQGQVKKGIEGCNNAVITATLPKKLTTDYIVVIDTMWGTATNGVDFPYVSDTIRIPAGQLSRDLVIAPLVDNLVEGQEDWNMIIQTSPCTIDTITIPIVDYIPISFSKHPNDTMVCGDSASLIAYPENGWNYIFSWSPANDIQNPTSLKTKALPAQSTMYIITVSDSSGCNAKDSMFVQVEDKIGVSFLPDVFFGCEPLTVNFKDMSYPNVNDWNWDFGDGQTSTQQHPSHIYNAGTFAITLKVESPSGCKGELNIGSLIEAYPKPNVWFEPNPPVTPIDAPTIDFSNLTKNGNSWQWNFGETSSNDNTSTFQDPSHTYLSEGTYDVWLVATSNKGCVDSLMRQIKIIIDEITVPNVITPNNDGFNDYLFIENIENLESSTLRIYNRWGKKVFEASPYLNNWNGNGVADGVYYYELDYKTYFREDTMGGTITIVTQ